MLYNSAILSVLAASTSLISTSVAAPVNARQFIPSCPTGTQYYDFESTSGFKGCTATPAEYQSGPRKYWQSCPPAHGNWYVCESGFKGCTTDSTICDPKSTAPAPVPGPVTPPVGPSTLPEGTCQTGQNYYVCATGFKGCSSDFTVCDPKPKPIDPIPAPTDPTTCPAGQTFYNCATGFKGCSWDHSVCDPKTPVDPKPVDTPAGGNGFCPTGTSYYDFEATSGFRGCTSAPAAYQKGPRVYWGGCPVGLGNWYVCANGFKGCNINTAVCDLKA